MERIFITLRSSIYATTGILIACLVIGTALTACKTAPVEKTPDIPASTPNSALPVFPKIDIWLTENKFVINAGQTGDIQYDKAFAQGVVLVQGTGLPLAGSEGAQKRLTAMRAAEVTAQRNLAEYFAKKAANGEIKFNSYTARLDAFLKGAQVVASEYNSEIGKAGVLLKLDLRGAKEFAR